ncbi:hypothetical protein V9T40_000443 [Parthenolecanium corni]|uniref:Magnesium transporter protein 1 n=1 Tax=Parthenolecanium corni TaxID=536013 RepID=A0AAN9TB63_9HEMI
MRFLLTVAILLCVLQCTYLFKNERSVGLADKISQLKELSAKKGFIKLNSAKFKDYVKWASRNYSFVIMFTALETHRQCTICKPVYEEFSITAKSFQMTYGLSDRLFFGVIDFDDGSEIFQKLQINTAPLIVFFPPKRKMNRINDLQTLDMQRLGFSAEAIGRWITDRTDLEFKIFRPPNYASTVGLLLLIFVGSVVMYFKQENFEFLQNRTVWAALTVVFCLLMTSGQMWNHIRSPPMYHKSANGISYIHGSSQGQFISETYLIFMLNACFAGCIIMIIDSGLGKENSVSKITTTVAVLFAALLFSAVLSIFKAKAGGYPYRGLL